jgi:hypothetical protein
MVMPFGRSLPLVVLVGAAGFATAQTYTVQQIATGNPMPVPTARINAGGTVAYDMVSSSWTWNAASGSQVVPGLPGTATTYTRGISDDGTVVGFCETSFGGDARAFRRAPGGPTQYVGHPGPVRSAALALNNNGIVVGWSDNGVSINSSYYWSAASGPVDITGAVGLDATHPNVATAVNDSGLIVGWGRFATSNANDMFVYSIGGTATQVTAGGLSSMNPVDVNGSGVVVGSVNTGGGATTWFTYSGGQLSQLAAPFSPRAISNSGVVVGQTTGATASAMIWSASSGYQAIAPMVLNGSGWTFSVITDINSSGQLVGYGRNPSGVGAVYLLNPVPEPATFAIVGVGVLPLLRRKRRQAN